MLQTRCAVDVLPENGSFHYLWYTAPGSLTFCDISRVDLKRGLTLLLRNPEPELSISVPTLVMLSYKRMASPSQGSDYDLTDHFTCILYVVYVLVKIIRIVQSDERYFFGTFRTKSNQFWSEKRTDEWSRGHLFTQRPSVNLLNGDILGFGLDRFSSIAVSLSPKTKEHLIPFILKLKQNQMLCV